MDVLYLLTMTLYGEFGRAQGVTHALFGLGPVQAGDEAVRRFDCEEQSSLIVPTRGAARRVAPFPSIASQVTIRSSQILRTKAFCSRASAHEPLTFDAKVGSLDYRKGGQTARTGNLAICCECSNRTVILTG